MDYLSKHWGAREGSPPSALSQTFSAYTELAYHPACPHCRKMSEVVHRSTGFTPSDLSTLTRFSDEEVDLSIHSSAQWSECSLSTESPLSLKAFSPVVLTLPEPVVDDSPPSIYIEEEEVHLKEPARRYTTPYVTAKHFTRQAHYLDARYTTSKKARAETRTDNFRFSQKAKRALIEKKKARKAYTKAKACERRLKQAL